MTASITPKSFEPDIEKFLIDGVSDDFSGYSIKDKHKPCVFKQFNIAIIPRPPIESATKAMRVDNDPKYALNIFQ